MNKLARYIIVIAVIAVVAFVVWYFKNIVGYVLAALALSFVARPAMRALSFLRIRKRQLPRTACAAISVIMLWGVFLGFISIFIPLITEQVKAFGEIETSHFLEVFNNYYYRLTSMLPKVVNFADFSVKEKIMSEVKYLLNGDHISIAVNSAAGMLKSTAIAAFAITFITFFFLKEEGIFFNFVMLLFPTRYDTQMTRALTAANQLLVRYFVGLFCDMLCMLTMLSLGLTLIAGFPFKQAMLIGLIAGVLNVIPYVGPLVGLSISVVFALAASLSAGIDFSVMALKTAAVFLAAQCADMAFLQPYIYSNSIKSHPLEIFLLILIAGNIGGIVGMLIAIPTYTILRVFAKEFFNNFRIIQKLTENI